MGWADRRTDGRTDITKRKRAFSRLCERDQNTHTHTQFIVKTLDLLLFRLGPHNMKMQRCCRTTSTTIKETTIRCTRIRETEISFGNPLILTEILRNCRSSFQCLKLCHKFAEWCIFFNSDAVTPDFFSHPLHSTRGFKISYLWRERLNSNVRK